MTIKDLGRWESLEMVQRYTRSVTFHDSLKLYKAPLSWRSSYAEGVPPIPGYFPFVVLYKAF